MRALKWSRKSHSRRRKIERKQTRLNASQWIANSNLLQDFVPLQKETNKPKKREHFSLLPKSLKLIFPYCCTTFLHVSPILLLVCRACFVFVCRAFFLPARRTFFLSVFFVFFPLCLSPDVTWLIYLWNNKAGKHRCWFSFSPL